MGPPGEFVDPRPPRGSVDRRDGPLALRPRRLQPLAARIEQPHRVAGRALGVTRHSVREIEARAFAKLARRLDVQRLREV